MVKRPKTRLPLSFLALILLTSSLGSSAWAASAEKLYEQGLLKESGEHDPESALELFRQTAEAAGTRNPALAADARLHMGRCLEKLGKTDEALGLYLVITKNPKGASAGTLQAAQDDAERVQTEMKRAADQAALEEAARRNASMIMVPEYRANGLSLLIGPGLVRGSGFYIVRGDVALRLRIFGERPHPLYLEVGALIPGGNQALAGGSYQSLVPAQDQAKLHLGYQFHVAIVRDLPHGSQGMVVPEIGVGAAYTTSRVDVLTSATDNFTGLPTTSTKVTRLNTWAPYLRAGVRLFANHPVSLLVGGSYTVVPYKGTASTGTPEHTATFTFPEKLWTASVQLQVRFGRTEYVARPKR